MADLVTLDEYKEHIGITSPTEDGKTEATIGRVSALVETYTSRNFLDFVTTDFVEFFDAKSTEVLLNEPLISVTSVKKSSDGGITQTDLVEDSVDLDGYFVDLVNSKVTTQLTRLQFINTYNHVHKSLEVTYKYGYTSFPEDLKLAVFDLITFYANDEKLAGMTSGSDSISNPGPYLGIMWPAHIKRVLDLYRYIM